MNLDNKFGKCCDCPGIYSGDRYFTNYMSSRIYNNELQNRLGYTDSHSYRLNLQTNGFETLKNNYNICTSDNNNKFYLDLSKYK